MALDAADATPRSDGPATPVTTLDLPASTRDAQPSDADRAVLAAIDLDRLTDEDRVALDRLDARLPASAELTDLMLERLADAADAAPEGRFAMRSVVIRRLERADDDPRLADQFVALAEDALEAGRDDDARDASRRARAALAAADRAIPEDERLDRRLGAVDRALAPNGRRTSEPLIVLDRDRVAGVPVDDVVAAGERDTPGAMLLRTTLFSIIVIGVAFAWLRRHGLLGGR